MAAPIIADQEAPAEGRRVPSQFHDFALQPTCDLDVHIDMDFVGSALTVRSTSGGVAMRGLHLIKHWSSTPKAITLNSGDAERCWIVKGTIEALGILRWAEALV